MKTEALLVVRGLTKSYPGVVALDGVDFDVVAGEVHCLVGQNGAGKSTLIKCLSGLVAPTSGEVRFDGEPLPVGDPAGALRRGIATIYQELDLVPHLTVAENVLLGHEPRRGPFVARGDMRRRTRELLQRLGHGELALDAPAARLKPASQQVVSMARALSRDVRLLILDEPSAVLDPGEVETLFTVIRRLADAGVGVIYISHRLEEVAKLGDRVTVLRDGRTVTSGRKASTMRPAKLVPLMVGDEVSRDFPPRDAELGDVALDVRHLTSEPAVRDVSFSVRAGEVVGFAGLVGSGRTELLRAIQGLDARSSGEVFVEGKRLPPSRPDVAVAAGVGLAPEERKSQGLLLDWSNVSNVSLASLGDLMRGPLLDRRRERREAHRHLRALGTHPDRPDAATRTLSGGNQQKVVLARWLLRTCRVLLLDEPTRGVDVAARGEIYRVIRALARDGLAVVVVSSDMGELLGLADRVFVLRDGAVATEVEASGTTERTLFAAAAGAAGRRPRAKKTS